MKKKSQKPAEPKRPTLLERLPKNRGEWLELGIKLTKRVISDPPKKTEKYLQDQVDRLTNELKKWRKNENKRF